MTKKIKPVAPCAAMPTDPHEVNAAIRRIGDAQRHLARLQAGMNDELAQIKERWEKLAEPYRQKIADSSAGVRIWCEAHRSELLKGDAKSAAFPAGEIGWRKRPPKCVVRGVDSVLDALRRLNLTHFIRVKEEVNKEAMLNEPNVASAVPGVSIESGEDFYIDPFETELAE